MLKLIRAGLVAVAMAFAFLPNLAIAQVQDDWTVLRAKVKGQSLSIMTANEDSYTMIANEFGKRFGVEVHATPARPSSALARIQTEQKSGQFIWDIWMGGTSNMVNSAAPGGLLEPMEKYFILPEVKDLSNWRHPDFIFGDSGHQAFTHANKLEFYVLRNTSVLPDVKVVGWDDLLNPKLKGKISIRDLSVPNAGTFAVATAYGVKGPAFVRKLLKDQEPKIYENPQQLDAAITRGGQAVSMGLESFLIDKCHDDGGCKDVVALPQFAAAISLGITIPKNPPHPDVAKAFINWFLSKEGQEFWVVAWAKYNKTGAVSMRKDVAPAPGHEIYLPDFANPKNYVFVSSEHGSEEIDATIKIFKDVMGK